MKKAKIKKTMRIVIYVVVLIVIVFVTIPLIYDYVTRRNKEVIYSPVCETCTIINKK